MTIVSPPPGVSSGVSVPPMPSVKPFESASPRPSPVELSVSPRRWNGANMSSRRSGGDPDAVVDDADLGGAAEAARRDTDAPAGGRVADGVREHVHEHALQQHRIGQQRPEGRDRARARRRRARAPSSSTADEHDVGGVDGRERHGEHAGLHAADVEQVGDEGRERREALVGGRRAARRGPRARAARRRRGGRRPRPRRRRAGGGGRG